jgi:hypothetical protein
MSGMSNEVNAFNVNKNGLKVKTRPCREEQGNVFPMQCSVVKMR